MKKIKGYLKGNKVSGQSIKKIQEHLGDRIQAIRWDDQCR